MATNRPIMIACAKTCYCPSNPALFIVYGNRLPIVRIAMIRYPNQDHLCFSKILQPLKIQENDVPTTGKVGRKTAPQLLDHTVETSL
jgi:hypothetical protein